MLLRQYGAVADRLLFSFEFASFLSRIKKELPDVEIWQRFTFNFLVLSRFNPQSFLRE